jgi:hypothetical protein
MADQQTDREIEKQVRGYLDGYNGVFVPPSISTADLEALLRTITKQRERVQKHCQACKVKDIPETRPCLGCYLEGLAEE